MPSRRSYLAGLTALLAGCTGPGSPTDTPPGSNTRSPTGTPTDPRSPTPTDGVGTCCYHVITMTADESDHDAVADAWTESVADLTERRRAIVDGSLGGETTVEDWRGHPLEAGSYLEADGTYYRVDETVVEERTVTTYRFEMRVPAREEPDGDPLAYDDLTAAERRVVDAGLDGWEPGDPGFGVGYGWVFESDEERDDCRFLDGDTYFVEYEGEVVSLWHDGTGETVLTTYRYAFPEVATDRASFTDLVVREAVGNVADAGFDDDAAAVAEDLFTSGHYRSENPATDAEQAVAYWCNDFTAPHGGYGDAYVRYEGDLYEVTVEEVMS
ncbi:hypothetical protein HUG10_10235 [Halorarum halophilum]|uniref:DUF7979 domain-containing protein n=1 Tax=Halorarum halophilum TaxID=2743090 RepID=A0A7D5GF29_9EURY|nr:hypothetical protein [Halobaculum halophilum]QLG27908.1 hypothetical protein HUG10_10235 [Halobaculum halophilum]